MELKLSSYQQMNFDYYVKSVEYKHLGKKTTVALITVNNGFEIAGTSACVDPADFVEEVGNHYALVDALGQLDGFLGFARQGKL